MANAFVTSACKSSTKKAISWHHVEVLVCEALDFAGHELLKAIILYCIVYPHKRKNRVPCYQISCSIPQNYSPHLNPQLEQYWCKPQALSKQIWLINWALFPWPLTLECVMKTAQRQRSAYLWPNNKSYIKHPLFLFIAWRSRSSLFSRELVSLCSGHDSPFDCKCWQWRKPQSCGSSPRRNTANHIEIPWNDQRGMLQLIFKLLMRCELSDP